MKFSIKIDHQSYEIEIEDLHTHPIVVLVDGERIEVEPQTIITAPLAKPPASMPPAATGSSHLKEKAAAAASPVASAKQVRAPIPGVIVSVLVRPGDEVVLGQELCIIEAMKMRNAIRSSHPGRIAEILVNPGQTVNHNDPLLSYEE